MDSPFLRSSRLPFQKPGYHLRQQRAHSARFENLPDRLWKGGEGESALRLRLDRAAVQVDDDLVAVFDGVDGFGVADHGEADVDGVAVKDAGGGLCDDDAKPRTLQGVRRLFPRRARPEILPRDEDGAALCPMRIIRAETLDYMLSWGSVIYNDILAPFRRRAWTDRRAILWNRCIIGIIGVYLLVFGLLYSIEGNVWSYLLLTGSIYLSSMSVLLVACCYWRRANNWGALGAIILGAAVPIAHLAMEKIPGTAQLAASIGKDAAGIAAFVAAAFGMIAGSLLKPRTENQP